jgi:transposase-like protein
MKCPRCNTENTRLSWLREFTVTYWCTNCNAAFEINRHRSKLVSAPRPITEPTEDNLAAPLHA